MNEDQEKKSFGFLPYLAVLLVAAIAVLAVFFLTQPETSEPGSEAESGTEASETETKAAISVRDTLAMEELIELYYRAKTEADADTLNRIVVSDQEYNAADLASDSNIIEKYDHFRSYIIPAEEEEYYVVYVTYDLYFLGISEGAPALNRFIMKRADDGFVIYDRFVDGAFEDFLSETEETVVVKNLKKQVEDDLAEACERNQDLDELIKFLESGTEAEESETDSEETESTDESDAETSGSGEAEPSGEGDTGETEDTPKANPSDEPGHTETPPSTEDLRN